MPTSQTLLVAVFIGVGATAVLDLWLFALKRLGVPTGSMALIGRWVAHMAHGRFRHASIAQAPRVVREEAIGWLTHYAVGTVFASALLMIVGPAWVHEPTFAPAFLTGVATVALPLLVMQPAMGSGFAASRTPTPIRNCVRSLANHAVFGAGLYLAACAQEGLLR